jgi:hypothetical protein
MAFKPKIIAFWDIGMCSLEVDRRFKGAYCLHHQGDFNETTRRYIPESCHLHARRRENLKSDGFLAVRLKIGYCAMVINGI